MGHLQCTFSLVLMKVRDSDVLVWVRGPRKRSEVLGAFGLLDFNILRPVFAWRAFLNLWTAYFYNFAIFFRASVNRGYPISEYGGAAVYWVVIRNTLTDENVTVIITSGAGPWRVWRLSPIDVGPGWRSFFLGAVPGLQIIFFFKFFAFVKLSLLQKLKCTASCAVRRIEINSNRHNSTVHNLLRYQSSRTVSRNVLHK
jgi:hypothetical protein